jgi:hypothetical protein
MRNAICVVFGLVTSLKLPPDLRQDCKLHNHKRGQSTLPLLRDPGLLL